MTMQVATQDRTAFMTTLVTSLGGSAAMRFYSGSRVAPSAWTAGSPLATVTFGSTAVTDSGGSVTSGVLTFGAYTQTASSHVTGTPTWVALVTSANRCVATIDVTSGVVAGSIQYSGQVVNGQNITGTMTLTAPNA